jgi:hypothetical protein
MGLWVAHKTKLPLIVDRGADLPQLWLWSDSPAACENSNISNYLAQSGRKQSQILTTNFSVAEGTNYCSQAILLVRPLQSSSLHQMAHQTMKNRTKKNHPANFPLSSQTRRAAPFPTQPRISTLKRDRDIEKPPVISASTWI